MFAWILKAEQFMPHGMCLLWQPGLMALHIVSDGLIALAYFAIPVGIALLVNKRPDLNQQHRAMAMLFAFFITACGLTHVMSILVLWRPYYDAEGLLKAVTALLSVATAVALPLLIPQLLRIPSPKTLTLEIEAHKSTLSQLQSAREQLAKKVLAAEDDLRETTRRFETAITGSPITVFEQTQDLRYTWVFNPPMGLDPAGLIGQTETDVFSPETAVKLQAHKRAALTSGTAQRAELPVARGEETAWFDIRVEPLTLRDGNPGIIATAADITLLKRQQDHLHLLMRELNHRSKNLLTIVISLVRQTGRGYNLPKEFLARLQERLGALANAHDVLARQNWSGADLQSIVEGQLAHQIQAFGPDRMSIEGPACVLPPEAAHYVAMALHELGSNAVKYGALAQDGGAVAVRWDVRPEEVGSQLHLVWDEAAGRPVPPPTSEGFGSRILTSLTPAAIGGRATLDFTGQGLRWTLTASLKRPGQDAEGEDPSLPPAN